jgi:hypothetical protein
MSGCEHRGMRRGRSNDRCQMRSFSLSHAVPTRKIGQQPSRSAAQKRYFPTQRKVFLFIDFTLGLSWGQGDEQDFSYSFDRTGLDAYKLFWVSRVARVRWRSDRGYGHGHAEEQVSFERNSPTIS